MILSAAEHSTLSPATLGILVAIGTLMMLFVKFGDRLWGKGKENGPKAIASALEAIAINKKTLESLEKKVAQRKEIQGKIDALGKKRSQFIKDELKKRGSGDKGFDAVVMKMIKDQGAKKGIVYGAE